MWRVGDGRKIRIGDDKWIPGIVGGKLGGAQAGGGCSPQMVEELIDEGRWNLNELKQWISEEDYKAIVSTPLSLCTVTDKLIWSGAKDGKYVVKNGYFHAKKEIDSGRICIAS